MNQETECIWSQQSNGLWETSCKQDFNIEDGTPEQNRFNFCCFCGHGLRQELYEEALEHE